MGKKKQVKMTYVEKDGVKKNIRYFEFDCPLCSANNPLDEGFRSGEEVLCLYCGATFRTRADSEGNLKLVEI
ncbi:MAG: hypothetical protein Kow0090_08470 [Myxococcota bacterium]